MAHAVRRGVVGNDNATVVEDAAVLDSLEQFVDGQCRRFSRRREVDDRSIV